MAGISAAIEVKARQKLAVWLSQHFFVRFHLSLILGFAFVAGLLTTKGFLALGMETMHWRWPLALLASYLAFLLAEAAFEGALAGGLVKSVRRVNDPGWVGFRASAIPFTVIFASAMTIAALAEHHAPQATTLVEAIHILLQ